MVATDASACNYDADADSDDGSCTYPSDDTLDCAGNCVNDADGDGVCDENEISGCTLEAACNYDPTATDNDGSCAQEDAAGVCGGSCQADADADGICDDIDDCVGALDECGVCNGDGIADGACDCDGNVLDECGVCGGDGIADGACDCDGNVLDECGVCGGDGIADGACDCDGNVLDECGVCGGDGIADGACDCDGNVLDECGVCGGDGSSCADPCAAAGQSSPYTLTIEGNAATAVPGATVYRFYVNANDATDKMSAVFGNDQAHLIIDAPDGIFNSTFNASWSASGINPPSWPSSRTWQKTATQPLGWKVLLLELPLIPRL